MNKNDILNEYLLKYGTNESKNLDFSHPALLAEEKVTAFKPSFGSPLSISLKFLTPKTNKVAINSPSLIARIPLITPEMEKNKPVHRFGKDTDSSFIAINALQNTGEYITKTRETIKKAIIILFQDVSAEIKKNQFVGVEIKEFDHLPHREVLTSHEVLTYDWFSSLHNNPEEIQQKSFDAICNNLAVAVVKRQIEKSYVLLSSHKLRNVIAQIEKIDANLLSTPFNDRSKLTDEKHSLSNDIPEFIVKQIKIVGQDVINDVVNHLEPHGLIVLQDIVEKDIDGNTKSHTELKLFLNAIQDKIKINQQNTGKIKTNTKN